MPAVLALTCYPQGRTGQSSGGSVPKEHQG